MSNLPEELIATGPDRLFHRIVVDLNVIFDTQGVTTNCEISTPALRCPNLHFHLLVNRPMRNIRRRRPFSPRTLDSL